MTPEEKFHSYYVPEPNTGCWLWTGAQSRGYGQMRIGYAKMYAHRFSYRLYNGPLADGLFICHKCDVRRCVNPQHLFQGTNQDNQIDCLKKRRFSRLVLSDDDVRDIRKIAAETKITNRALAKIYDVNHGLINAIINRKSWKHL